MSVDIYEALGPLHLLVAGSAGGHAQTLRMLFALDRRCADICRSTTEAMIGQMRLAWWRDALAAGEGATPQRGEPLLDELRVHPSFDALQPHLARIIDGWEEFVADPLAQDTGLLAFARGRGGGLFGGYVAATGHPAEQDALTQAGAVWALWDLAGHVRDPGLRDRAVALASGLQDGASPHLPKPLAILARLSRADIARGWPAPPHMTPGLYLRVLGAQILGR